MHRDPATDRDLLEPPALRRLRRLVTVLTVTLIFGILAIVGLLAVRLSAVGGGVELPAEIALPVGETAGAVTFGGDWLAVVTTDRDGRQRIRVLDRASGADRGSVEIAPAE